MTDDGRALHVQISCPSHPLLKIITIYEPEPGAGPLPVAGIIGLGALASVIALAGAECGVGRGVSRSGDNGDSPMGVRVGLRARPFAF